MPRSDLASFLPRIFPPQFLFRSMFRVLILPSLLAGSVFLSVPHAWATAAPTTTTLAVTSGTTDVTSVAAGTVVTLTATVVSGSTPVHPGQVRFCVATATHCEDSALLATAQLTTAGVATFKFRPGVGSHSYQAVFVGTSSYAKSTSTALDLTVTPSATTYPIVTTIASSGGIGDYTLTATVMSTGTPLSLTGSISFLDTSNSNTVLGTATLGAATASLTFTTVSTLDVDSLPVYAVMADFNGDGIPDLAIANYQGGTVSIFLGKGDGTFSLLSTLPAPGVGWISVADFNGDGIVDLAFNNAANNLVVLLGNGDGTFTTKTSIGIAGGIAVGDFNGDGIPDMAVMDGPDTTLTILLGNGDGTFTAKFSTNIPNANGSVAAGDFNGDGTPDLAIVTPGGCGAGTVEVLLGNGDGTFTAKSSLSVGDNPVHVVVADFNGDGIPDLATENDGCNGEAGTVSVLLGNGDGTFTLKSSPASGTVPLLAAQITTTLTLSSSSNPSYKGIQITLTATLSPYIMGSFTTNGETVTFYNEATSIGTGTLSAGVATLNIATLPVRADALTAVYAGDGSFAAATSNALAQTVNPTPAFVVTVTTDTTSGGVSNCTGAGSPNCSLYDALAAAAADGGGNITFDPTVFATPQTVPGGLSIPSGTTITGPTTGSGATLTNLVTVSGGGSVFTVNPYVTNAAISGLTITGGYADEGGGILNSGTLTVSDSTISGNLVDGGVDEAAYGGGIANLGTLTLINCSVTGNSASLGGPNGAALGGGIYTQGPLTIINSSVVGNNASGTAYGSPSTISVFGGGIFGGVTTMTNSVVAGNSANAVSDNDGADFSVSGGGIDGGVTTATNNIISGNTTNGSEDDCDDGSCGTNGVNGNLIGPGVQLAPFGNYGGPTQTILPLPGSSAICGGVVADIPPGVTTDQRGFPRTTTYTTPSGSVPCVDSGPVQTNYSLSFSTEPPSTIPANIDFAAALQLSESGSPFTMSGIGITIGLATGDNGALNVSSLTTNSSGIAGSSQLAISAAGSDKLVAALQVTTAPPPAPLTSPISVGTASSALTVTPSVVVHVTVSASPAGPVFSVDGVPYSASVTMTWVVGSQHTVATTSPQSFPGAQYTFASWSDGGALSHTVTATSGTTSYTANFNAAYQLMTAANPSQAGTVSPASGSYYPAGSVVNLLAKANPPYIFSFWIGAVANAGQPSTTITMSSPASVTANFSVFPVVNTDSDDATGAPAHCTSTSQTPCTLRDALAAATAAGGGTITFDPTVFAAAQPVSARTITLTGGTLNVGANTTISGPGNVTVNGNNQYNDFTMSAANVVISGLTIRGGNGGISNSGALTVAYCTISGNTAGGIANNGTLTVVNSAISGNTSPDSQGGGIFNDSGGTLTVLGSVISGNSASVGGAIYDNGGTVTVTGSAIYGNSDGIDSFIGTVTVTYSTIYGNNGGGLYASGSCCDSNGDGIPATLTVVNSTVSGNNGGGIGAQGTTLTVTNSIVAGNTASGSADCPGSIAGCPTNGVNGNITGVAPLLAPLGNYGGPTPTMPPLPGSPAICTGLIADALGTDQRGFPGTTTYNGTPCVDSGSVQTDYSLSFSTEPPAIVGLNVAFASAVQLNESSSPFPLSGINIPLALGKGSTGALTGNTAATDSSGTADYTSLLVNAIGSGDTLVATLPLTASGVTPAAAASVTSTAFDVLQPAATPVISPSAGTYTSAQSVTITDTTSGATIYYTNNGTTPTTSSTKYAGTIAVSSTETIEAIAVVSGYANSVVASATYTITPPAAPPIFTPGTGTYTSAQTVTITDATADATIYYTINGTTPTTASTKYAGAITVSSSESIEAIAVASGYTSSPVTSATFTIAAGKAAALQFIP